MNENGKRIDILDSVVTGLKDSWVQDNLPVHIKKTVNPVLAKDPRDWNDADKSEVVQAVTWCVCNLPSQPKEEPKENVFKETPPNRPYYRGN
jgi:hypothetical protein